MTVLRLSARTGTRIGSALALVPATALARRGDMKYAEVPRALVAPLTRALAFAGVAAEPCDADLAPPPGSFLARGVDLSPLPPGAVDLDLVRLERLALGRATRETLRRRLAGLLPPNEADRARCRALLRRENVIFAWSRFAWASRAALRGEDARHALRPIVFDRDAARDPVLVCRTTSQADDLGRWLFA